MGVITEKIKQKVLEQFEIQKDKADILQALYRDEMGFIIKRANGHILDYDGALGEFVHNNQ